MPSTALWETPAEFPYSLLIPMLAPSLWHFTRELQEGPQQEAGSLPVASSIDGTVADHWPWRAGPEARSWEAWDRDHLPRFRSEGRKGQQKLGASCVNWDSHHVRHFHLVFVT